MKLGVAFYYVGDISKATKIYSQFLGTPPVYSDVNWVRFHLDGGDLALHSNTALPETDESSPVRYGAVVSFTVTDMLQVLTRAMDCGFRQVGEQSVQDYGIQAEIRDPWGNRLSLLQPLERQTGS